jgi:hypothetical protein
LSERLEPPLSDTRANLTAELRDDIKTVRPPGTESVKKMRENNLGYQDFIDELVTGSHYGVFIDDTGSPGGSSSKLLPADRRTWVAVVIPPSQTRQTYYRFGTLLAHLKERFNVSELHFTDIYGGNREFANIGWEDRLGIFETMAKSFGEYGYPILIQSLEPSQLSEWRAHLQLPASLGVFNLRKPKDAALFLLLLKVRMHVQKNQLTEPGTAHVFIDEGWKKNGVALQSEALFGSVFDRYKVCFGSSKDIFLLQLADFAAFVLNRMQLTGGKDIVKIKERHLLQIVQPMTHLYQDISRMQLKIHNGTGKIQREHEPEA